MSYVEIVAKQDELLASGIQLELRAKHAEASPTDLQKFTEHTAELKDLLAKSKV